MTSGEITAITLAAISAAVAIAPPTFRFLEKTRGKSTKDEDKIARLQRSFEDLQAVQAKCEVDRKNDRRLMRWIILRIDADRPSHPPDAGPLARALSDLFADDTGLHESPAE